MTAHGRTLVLVERYGLSTDQAAEVPPVVADLMAALPRAVHEVGTVGQPGDVVCQRAADGAITVVTAPRYAYMSIALLGDPTASGLRFADDCVIVAGVAWYRPVGFAEHGRALVCKLVRDDRPR